MPFATAPAAASRRIGAMVALASAIALLTSTSGALMRATAMRSSAVTLSRSLAPSCSLFNEEGESRQAERLRRVAAYYNLDLEADAMEVAARAASSLPEEETGTWSDVAICTARNLAVVAALLAAVGALPGQASAAVAPAGVATRAFATLPTELLAVDAETLDVIASVAVPLLVGGALVVVAASQYENLIDKLNDGR